MARPSRSVPQAVSPRPSVEIGSAGEVGEHLLSLCFEEAVNRPSRCRLAFNDWGRDGFLLSETPTVDFGVALSLGLTGASGAAEPIFAGRIYSLGRRQDEGSQPVLTVEAFDRLQELAMVRRARHFEDTTLADLLSQLAGEHGLDTDIDLDGPAHGALVQANESDLDFVTRLLEDLDGELWIEDDALHARHHRQRPGGTVTLRPQRDLFSLRIEAALTGQRGRLTVHGWDVAAKEPVEETADPDAFAAELGDMLSGGALLSLVGAPGPDPQESLVHRLAADAATAEGLAAARYTRLSRGFVALSAEARGNAALRVGAQIELEGAGLRFDGRYVVARVRHRFDAEQGYRCEIEAGRSGVER